MMRLARRTSLLVAFYVLTSIASAAAEPVWVLWQHVMTNNPPAPDRGSWTPSGACDTRADCQTDSRYTAPQLGVEEPDPSEKTGDGSPGNERHCSDRVECATA